MVYLRSRISAKNIGKAQVEKKVIEIDPFKWTALAITVFGILAWVAGAAYNEGYWNITAWHGAIARKTPQDTAFDGFTGPTLNWLFAFLLLAAVAFYTLFLEFVSSLSPLFISKSLIPAARKIQWLAGRRKMSADTKKFSAYSIISSIVGIVVIFLFAAWISSAAASGRKQIQKEICGVRNAAVMPSFVELDGSVRIPGEILDETEKNLVLLDKSSIYIISVGEKSKLIAQVDVRNVQCSAPGK